MHCVDVVEPALRSTVFRSSCRDAGQSSKACHGSRICTHKRGNSPPNPGIYLQVGTIAITRSGNRLRFSHTAAASGRQESKPHFPTFKTLPCDHVLAESIPKSLQPGRTCRNTLRRNGQVTRSHDRCDSSRRQCSPLDRSSRHPIQSKTVASSATES
ncbi:hypothetical protein PsorP6_003196 [Peronosclerospora sorghi]|uniref:Uncharacterized protein n=1 Tax=Peronosclerospora sorghi TaxID=230839 RepID=A0ACC0VMM9_9STRA|nr:hypothetical protein PsorP6_003196 [Peronosclerospora sorghi]